MGNDAICCDYRRDRAPEDASEGNTPGDSMRSSMSSKRSSFRNNGSGVNSGRQSGSVLVAGSGSPNAVPSPRGDGSPRSEVRVEDGYLVVEEMALRKREGNDDDNDDNASQDGSPITTRGRSLVNGGAGGAGSDGEGGAVGDSSPASSLEQSSSNPHPTTPAPGASIHASSQSQLDAAEVYQKYALALAAAAKKGDVAELRAIWAKHGSPMLLKFPGDLTNSWMAVHFAAEQNNPAVVKEMLDFKVNIDVAAPNDGFTPLIVSSRSRAGDPVSCVRFLCERKASLDSTDNNGDTALAHAVRGGFIDVVQVLVEAGATIRADAAATATAESKASSSSSAKSSAAGAEDENESDDADAKREIAARVQAALGDFEARISASSSAEAAGNPDAQVQAMKKLLGL